jgi:hypothetical protein
VRGGVGRDEAGRAVQRSRTVRGGIREARRVRAELLLSADNIPKPTASTVAELGKRWLADLERRGKSPNTVHGYKSPTAFGGPPTQPTAPPPAAAGLLVPHEIRT